ncbi:hypothetical protein AWU67_13200 [Microterricola viridarii]|uniref:M23ase beta-sheet core domain-containing protein n=1 Tax=Microterricola viridarii TaxID=412690 RepID=A0A0X8E429_9MICO|nr:hypothetical protein AWU67_13200 [Microterricola viridarii]
MTRREIRERERALELATGEPQEPATAVLPIVAEVPTRTAILPAVPQPEPHTAESYAELLNALVLPAPDPAPLATAEDFMHAAAPAAFAAELPEQAAALPIRRSRRAADVEVDAILPTAVATPGSRRSANPRGQVEPLGASELSAANLDTASADEEAPQAEELLVDAQQTTALLADALRVDALFSDILNPDSVSGAQTSDPAQRRRSAGRSEPLAVPRASTTPGASRTATPRAAVRTAPTLSVTRRIATKTTAIVAMGFVALMAVATSVPAEALLTADDVKAAALVAKMPSKTEPGQSVIAHGADSITVQADGYETATIAEAAAASGIRMESTFVNNPNGAVQWPFAVGVHVGDRFGFRDCAGCSSNHGGQDFNPGNGAEIQSIADGVVTLAEDGEGSLGVHMMIEHQINGETITSVYAHMQHGTMRYSTGDVVKVGDVIGNTGTTGMSTGPHLHFEIRLGGINGVKVDPLDWLYANTN